MQKRPLIKNHLLYEYEDKKMDDEGRVKWTMFNQVYELSTINLLKWSVVILFTERKLCWPVNKLYRKQTGNVYIHKDNKKTQKELYEESLKK